MQNIEDFDELVSAAKQAKGNAYAPYSKFSVGAALRVASGEIFTGCNVENISFGLTLCAERGAVAAAVRAGKRDFATIAIVTDATVPATPCGACRQVLAEFNNRVQIISESGNGDRQKWLLSELLPWAKTGTLDILE